MKSKHFAFLVGIILLACFALHALTGCNTDKRAYRQADKFHYKHPDVCDSDASKWYSLKPDTVIKIKVEHGLPIFVSGDTVVSHDTTVYYQHDTVVVKVTKTVTKHDLRVDTVDRQTTVTEDGPKLKYANDKLQAASEQKRKDDKEIAELKSGSLKLWLWAIIATAVIIFYVAIKVGKI